MELIVIVTLFVLLAFWHFPADWLFQSHKEAMAKAADRKVRLWHCIKYAAAYLPLFWYVGVDFGSVMTWAAFGVLLVSHYVIDSYVPVMLWAKYLRRAPQFDNVGKTFPPQPWSDKVIEPRGYENNTEAFKAFASTPLGLILVITMDQFFHIACLMPVAWLLVH